VDSKAELDAIVADYLHQAARLQVVPAAAIPFDRFLADLAAESAASNPSTTQKSHGANDA
jgi:hypothetical protein